MRYTCWYFSISLLPDKLGEGEFGEVYEATLLGDVRGQSFAGLTVAVKGLKGMNWCCTRGESEGTHITYDSAKYE